MARRTQRARYAYPEVLDASSDGDGGDRQRWRCRAPCVGAGRVGADEIADKQAQAEQISAKLADLDTQMETLGEEYNQARLQLDQMQVDIDAAAKRVDAANRELAQRQHELDNYAVAAYMNGGSGGATEALLTGQGDEVGRQIEYLQGGVGQPAQDHRRGPGRPRGRPTPSWPGSSRPRQQAESLQHDLDQKRADTEKASNQQQALLASVNGELLQLVQEAQDRAAQQADETVKARLPRYRHRPPGQPVGDPTAPTNPSSPTTTRNPTSPSTTAPPATTPTTVRPVTPPPTPPPPGPPPAPLPAAARAVALARTQLGVPYLWAGSDPEDGFDCSGLIMWAYAGAGKILPHSSQLMANVTRHIAFTDLAARRPAVLRRPRSTTWACTWATAR